MNTKSVPAVIMLLAGAVACILGIVNQYENEPFFSMVLTVLIIFYFIGCIVKIILDKNFPKEDKNAEDAVTDSEEEKENIESEDSIKIDE